MKRIIIVMLAAFLISGIKAHPKDSIIYSFKAGVISPYCFKYKKYDKIETKILDGQILFYSYNEKYYRVHNLRFLEKWPKALSTIIEASVRLRFWMKNGEKSSM